jgi:hypothetical protein
MLARGVANPHAPKPRAKRERGGALRWVGYAGAVLLTIVIIAVVSVGIRTVADRLSGPSTIDSSATSFSDGLTSNAYSWADDSNAFFRSDGYHIVKSVIVYAPVDPQQAVDVSVRVVQISGDTTWDYGVVFRRASKGNYYLFQIDSNGLWRFDKVVNGTLTNLMPATPNDAIHRGLNASNTLEVQADGSHSVFLVNGTQVGQADDSTFTSRGKVGLEGNDGIEVVYTHLTMKWHN